MKTNIQTIENQNVQVEEIKQVIPIQTKIGTPKNVEEWLHKYYEFKFNVVLKRVEQRKKIEGALYEMIDDYFINSLVRHLNMMNLKCNNNLLRNLLHSDFVKRYNPFVNHIENLPTWDGETDYIKQLTGTVNTTNNVLFEKSFIKWFVAMIGCAINEKIINHTVLVFTGAQGIGKTTWIQNLIPMNLQEYFYSGTINPDNKDTLIQLSESMLINMDELENLNNSQLGKLKELITKPAIKIRRPYGYSNENLVRRASFAGSVNGTAFLTDTTGNRRFLCFEVKNLDYKNNINIDLAYAQALHLFRNGFQYWFEKDEIDEINSNNENYRQISSEEELLLQYFMPCEKEKGDYYLNSTDIINHIKTHFVSNISNLSNVQMGKILSSNKFLKIKRKGNDVYALKLKKNKMHENDESEIKAETLIG